jgi:cation-transporting P-type ATPase E
MTTILEHADRSPLGLTQEEADRRLAERGKVRAPQTSRSYPSIIRANTLTIPNGILFVFGVLTILFGELRDALFLGVLVSNVVIGSFQEIRSKRALDKLAALVAPAAVVVRDGTERTVPVSEVVVGDVVRIAPGDQVVADGTLLRADGIAVDEANLTGESEPVVRAVEEPVWSGSFVVEGTGVFEASAVGEESRAGRLAATARAFRHPRSPLERATDKLLLWLVILAAPIAIGLIVSVLVRDHVADEAVQAITAGIVNMVPEGLILLVSLTAAVSAFKLAQRGVLAQQLNAIESLASVDVLCTDKTGTLTEPNLRVVDVVAAAGVAAEEVRTALTRYAASAPARNATLEAVAEGLPAGGDAAGEVGAPGSATVTASQVVAQVPFSSRRRWSALDLGDQRLVFGAPERFAGADPGLDQRAERDATAGRRVLAIGRADAPLPKAGPDVSFPEAVRPLGLVVLAERLRPHAAETVAFFAEEKVSLKVLSGDAPPTVGAIARDAGIPGTTDALDARSLPEDSTQLREALLAAPAVGRISPDDKKRVVASLAEDGGYVGMVGDGVNDVPALKEARLAIAQGSGTEMARSVADLILVRDDFAVVPGMVAEGRQILRNLRRVARLFVTKTVFVAFLALTIGITTATFPLLPRQFTLASTVTIGIPAFFLALARSSGSWRPEGLVRSVARFALPAGIAVGVGIAGGYVWARYGMDLDLEEARTVATGIVVTCGLAVLARIENEPGRRRVLVIILIAAMALLFLLALAVPFARDFFALEWPDGQMLLAWAAGSAVGIVGMLAALRLTQP